jgi:hypothetical protein
MFQITYELSVAGCLKFMQKAAANGASGSTPNHATFASLVAKPSSVELLK